MRSGAREPATMSDAQRRAAADRDLARLVAGGDRLAPGELYSRHAGPCFALARRVLADRVLAEEVVQEVFLDLWRRPEAVRRALADLSDGERGAIELAYFGGHTYREVAVLLDVPEGTVKSRIRSGLLRLRAALIDAGVNE